jgi:hypothetical protein
MITIWRNLPMQGQTHRRRRRRRRWPGRYRILSARGASAVLIEMQDAAGRDLDIITKNAMLTMLDEHQVEQHMNTQLMAVTPTISPLKNTEAPSTFPSTTALSAWGCAPTGRSRRD